MKSEVQSLALERRGAGFSDRLFDTATFAIRLFGIVVAQWELSDNGAAASDHGLMPNSDDGRTALSWS